MNGSGPMRNLRGLGLAMVLLAGCLSVPRETPAPIHTFLLNPEQPEGTASRTREMAGGLVLLLNMPQARPGFETARMAYVRRPHELAYYAIHQWADSPARMLRSFVMQELERTMEGWAVAAMPSPVRGDYRLDVDQVLLVQEFLQQPSRVRFAIRAQLFKLPDHQIVGTKEFEAVEPAQSEDAYGGVIAANRTAGRVVADLRVWLEGCVGAGRRAAC